MPHVFELAPSGRSRCRGCAKTIERETLRFGERVPNPFAEGEMTLWFHPLCAAYKRPEPLLEALAESGEIVIDREHLESISHASVAHRRLPRIDGAEMSPGSQATCRHCRQRIERGSWRIRLVFYEEGRFAPGGFIHLRCSADYFETADVMERVVHFSSSLSPEQLGDLKLAFSPNST